jgi:hypothetical protein
MKKGPMAGYEIVGCKMCLDDGSYHAVDSSEMAFRICRRDAFHEAFSEIQALPAGADHEGRDRNAHRVPGQRSSATSTAAAA